jgi:hypothetical protein
MIADAFRGCNARVRGSGGFGFANQREKPRVEADGGHSSMVEPQIVVLAVAGSSPVGHPLNSTTLFFLSNNTEQANS